MIGVKVDPTYRRIVATSRPDSDDEDRPVLEVVLHRDPVDGEPEQVHICDASMAPWPYGQTLATLTWQDADALASLLNEVLDIARTRGWLYGTDAPAVSR